MGLTGKIFLAAIILLVAVGGYYFFDSGSAPEPAGSEGAKTALRCPECGLLFQRTEDGKAPTTCPHCADKGPITLELVSPEEVRKGLGKPPGASSGGPTRLLFPILVVSMTVILGLMLFLFTRKWPGRAEKKEERNYVFTCIRCHRKLRYGRSLVGQKAICPRCKQRFMFPPPPSDSKRPPRAGLTWEEHLAGKDNWKGILNQFKRFRW
jgi:DNA-directed RNA polymerase subunit RPC12/RpoP